MNVEDAAAAVAYLASMTSGWSDDATEQLVYEFERLDDPYALIGACGAVARTWTWGGRPPLGVLIDAYHHEVAVLAAGVREQTEASAPRCDGHGWNEVDDDLTPCATCNAALWRIWNEPGARRRWRNGQATWKILGYDSAADCEKELARPRCPTAYVDELDRFRGNGLAVALDAYRDEYGKEPSERQKAWLLAAARPAPRRAETVDDVF